MTAGLATRSPARAAIGTLAVREAGRMLAHPVYLVLLVYFLVLTGVQAVDAGLASRATVREILMALGLLWLGPATFFAANLVASSARRSQAESQLAAAPTTEQARTLATCLGVLGPAVLAAAFATVLWFVEHGGGLLERAPGPAELAAIPVCTLGGGLLGVAVERWMPWRGAPLIVMFALIAWVVAVMGRDGLQWTAPWTVSPAYFDELDPARGSHGWHALYLMGLGLLATVAALLRFASYRRPLLMLGGALLAATIAAGSAQLP